jgi:hypothetical protein
MLMALFLIKVCSILLIKQFKSTDLLQTNKTFYLMLVVACKKISLEKQNDYFLISIFKQDVLLVFKII